jgi:6-phosphogluconolactonase
MSEGDVGMSHGPPAGHEIRVYEDEKAWTEGGAKALLRTLHDTGEHPRLVLAGGRTPLPIYQAVSSPVLRGQVDWKTVRITFSDERAVPPDHAESNYGLARETLIGPLGIRPRQVLRLRGENPAEEAAEKAHSSLREWAQRIPLFDVVLLGLGQDGHVASLFPADSWPDWGERWAVATSNPKGAARISLTPAALRSTRVTMFLISGEPKAQAVNAALTATEITPQHPSRMVSPPDGCTIWILDAAAASGLPPEWQGTIRPRRPS